MRPEFFGDVSNRDVGTQLCGHGCNANICQPTRDDPVEPAKIRIDVDRKAMHRRTGSDADANCRNFAVRSLCVSRKPDARAAPDPTGAEPAVGEHGDHGFLEPSHVINNEQGFG
jgi:hypothetical protein